MSEKEKVLIGYKGVKYGLQQSKKSLPPKPSIFGDDSSEDESVSKQVAREQERNLRQSKVAAAQEAAVAEDSTVFEYDTVYDEMQRSKVDPRKQDVAERRPKYIQELMRRAEIRKKEQDIAYERRMLKERKADDHLYTHKEAFITEAYKTKLKEDKYWIEREKALEAVEEKEDVTKKSDLSSFYQKLCTKNVAYASNQLKAHEEEIPQPAPLPPKLEEIVEQRISIPEPGPATQLPDLEPQGEIPVQEKDKEVVKSEETKVETGVVAGRKKRRNDEESLASARDRYLARKQSRQNMSSL